MNRLAFEVPTAWLWGTLASGLVLGLFAFAQHRRHVRTSRVVVLTSLRAAMLLALVALAARPVWTRPDETDQQRTEVVVLFDGSESMSLREETGSRFESALEFARAELLPLLNGRQLSVQPLLFAEDANPLGGQQLAAAQPDGLETNLARAITRGVLESRTPPLAVIALTDGATTVEADNSRAVSALASLGVPFVGIGFGSEQGGRVLSLEDVFTPSIVSPQQHFRVSARLRATGDQMPAFDLLLMRDGQLIDRRTIPAATGARLWQESFEVSEDEQGLHHYTVQLLPPPGAAIKSPSTEATGSVRVVEEGELRVLYLQGGLTWDYKFVQIALRNDPAIQLSGLSRTASTSQFFENVQNDIDLVEGFPSTIEKLNEFRVVILSNLRPGDLTPRQQELLAQFCGEYGGGVLMIGGPETFHGGWQNSRLEELLPVTFQPQPGPVADAQFRIELTEATQRHPVFQISDDADPKAAWSQLPTFTHPARVDRVKPGAEVWLTHDHPGAGRNPVLMAVQRFGNGMSGVICMQNFWRWRLARQSRPEHFDRFWQQLLRFLSEGGRESITLTLRDQRLAPDEPIRLSVERRADPSQSVDSALPVVVRLIDEQQQELDRETLELTSGQTADATLNAGQTGTLTATVESPGGSLLATRSIDIREISSEFLSTSIRMPTLQQWAGVSGGFAVRASETNDLAERLETLLEPTPDSDQRLQYSLPAGINGWSLTLLLVLLSTEWGLRKHWGMS